MRFRHLIAVMAGFALVPAAGCSPTEEERAAEMAKKPLSEAIASLDSVSGFAAALEKTGLDGIFEGPGDYTVLAPENGAFGDVGETSEDAILAAVLREHILPGTILPDDIRAALQAGDGEGEPVSVATMGSGAISFSMAGERIVATSGDGRKAILSDLSYRAANGVVIPVDAVLRDTNFPEE
jgi:uncharacterized surface protein with fasciclin (FAS1) repeats